jgi:hypothetical protein
MGTGMSGAHIFVMYADGTGNVTISARDGVGHVQPLLDSSLESGVTLLAGSGDDGTTMTGYVRCMMNSGILEAEANDHRYIV